MRKMILGLAVNLYSVLVFSSDVNVDPQHEDPLLQEEQVKGPQFYEDPTLQQEKTDDIQFKEDPNLGREQTRDEQFLEDQNMQQERELNR